jgi:DNA-binding transcriptional regulator GbsR (MarR family)
MKPSDSLVQKFVLQWSEIGTHWGMTRTEAQIHALLFISTKILTADEIKDALDIARSNVSMSLRELLNWGLIHPVHTLGERKTRYECVSDGQELFRRILEGRKKREIEPALQFMGEYLGELKKVSGGSQVLQQMNELFVAFKRMAAFMDELIDNDKV